MYLSHVLIVYPLYVGNSIVTFSRQCPLFKTQVSQTQNTPRYTEPSIAGNLSTTTTILSTMTIPMGPNPRTDTSSCHHMGTIFLGRHTFTPTVVFTTTATLCTTTGVKILAVMTPTQWVILLPNQVLNSPEFPSSDRKLRVRCWTNEPLGNAKDFGKGRRKRRRDPAASVIRVGPSRSE
jgi:hypothetical protein